MPGLAPSPPPAYPARMPDPSVRGAAPLASRWLRIDGRPLHIRVSTPPAPPGRPPVVLVHGLGMSSRYLAPLARLLAPEFRVAVPDLPGFGRSPGPARALDVPGLAAALAAILDALDLPPAVLIGNSLGCEIAVHLALTRPERVAALVLQGPTPDPRDRGALRSLIFFAATAPFERPSLALVALADYLRCGPRRFIQTFRAMLDHRIEPALPHIAAPALVIRGSRDFFVPHRAAARIAGLLPNGRLVTLPGAAHGMPYSHPRAFRDAVLPFLLR